MGEYFKNSPLPPSGPLITSFGGGNVIQKGRKKNPESYSRYYPQRGRTSARITNIHTILAFWDFVGSSSRAYRIGDDRRDNLYLVPAPAVRLTKIRVLSRPGVKSLLLITPPL